MDVNLVDILVELLQIAAYYFAVVAAAELLHFDFVAACIVAIAVAVAASCRA
jgi:hypothetical protein